MHIIMDELCMNTILPILDGDEALRIVYEYSDRDGGTIDVYLTYQGENTDPLEDADELSMKLIRHYCQDLTWEYHDGQCSISCRMV